jgi:biopolymer transport protein ExbB
MNADFLQRILKSWVDGGWTMIPIAMVAFALYSIAFQLIRHLGRRVPSGVSDSDLNRWIAKASEAPENVGPILQHTTFQADSLETISARFAEVTACEVPEVDRRVQMMQVYIASAPLLGLLGTVLGMLTTFQGIASGGGKMADTIAQGISEALITTEMGLLVALPGMILSYVVRRRRNEYIAFLALLESLTLRHFRQRQMAGMTHVFRRDTLSLGTQIRSTSPSSLFASGKTHDNQPATK